MTFVFIMFSKIINADINKEVSDLKNEFKQIKKIYETKIQALENKIEQLEYKKESNEVHSAKKSEHKSHDEHNGHNDESNFNLEAVLNGKFTSFSKDGEVAPKGFGTAHEGERGREGLQIGESELIINSADICRYRRIQLNREISHETWKHCVGTDGENGWAEGPGRRLRMV